MAAKKYIYIILEAQFPGLHHAFVIRPIPISCLDTFVGYDGRITHAINIELHIKMNYQPNTLNVVVFGCT